MYPIVNQVLLDRDKKKYILQEETNLFYIQSDLIDDSIKVFTFVKFRVVASEPYILFKVVGKVDQGA